MRTTISAMAALTCVAASALPAQQVLPSVPQSLGLEEAIELGHRFNPGLRQVTNDRGAAAWGVRNAYTALFLPSVNASANMTYQGAGSQTFLSQEFNQESGTIGSGYSLGLSWQLSGATLSQPGVAKAELRAADAAIDGARVTLEATVTQQYLAVLQAEAQESLTVTQVTRNEEFLRLAQARFQVGQATMLDVRQAEVAKGQADVALLQARQAVIVEKLRLFQQMGVAAPEDPSVVTLRDTFPVVEPVWTLGDLLREAEEGNPDVYALRARASAARSGAHAVKSQWLPSLNFSAGWRGFTRQFTNSEFLIAQAQQGAASAVAECEFTNRAWLNPGADPADLLPCGQLAFSPTTADAIRASNDVFPFSFRSEPFSASLTISLPLFTQFGRPARVAQASQQAEDAYQAVEARRLQVRTDVSQMFYGLRAAYQTIAIQQTNRVAAQEQLRLAQERYRVGSGTFFELLDAQVAAQRADADLINAVYAYHRSVASLEAAVGRSLR
jgi:outer membrane protein